MMCLALWRRQIVYEDLSQEERKLLDFIFIWRDPRRAQGQDHFYAVQAFCCNGLKRFAVTPEKPSHRILLETRITFRYSQNNVLDGWITTLPTRARPLAATSLPADCCAPG